MDPDWVCMGILRYSRSSISWVMVVVWGMETGQRLVEKKTVTVSAVWRALLLKRVRRAADSTLSWLNDKRSIVSWTIWGLARAVLRLSLISWATSSLILGGFYVPEFGAREVIPVLLIMAPVSIVVTSCCFAIGFVALLICMEMNRTREGASVASLKCSGSVQELRLVLLLHLARLKNRTRSVALPEGEVVIRAHDPDYLLLGYVVVHRQGNESVCRVVEYPLLKAYGSPARALKRRRGWRFIERVHEAVRSLDPSVVVCSDSRGTDASRVVASGDRRE